MKAKELRIGNKIIFSEDETIFTVGSIDEKGFTVQNEEETTWIENYQFDPIPLTEEILLKCGFEKIVFDSEETGYGVDYNLKANNDLFINYSDDFSCGLYSSKSEVKNSLSVIPFWGNTKTVHGLQNLYFALTGEELEINL